MGDSSILGALPIGLLLFLGMYLGMRRRKLGLRKASAHYPLLATELGLGHRPPRYANAVGALSGERHGRRVHVDPDERMRIAVAFASPVDVDLRSYLRNQRAGATMQSFHVGRGAFERLFVHRQADPAIADALVEHADSLNGVSEELRRLRRAQLREVAVTRDGAECVFDFGKPPHLPADTVREVLPLLETLVDRIERAVATVRGPIESENGRSA